MLSIIIGFIILMTLIILKVSIVVAAPLSSAVILYLNNLKILEILNSQYLPGFASFVEDYIFIFLLGAILGKVMEESDDATSIGEFVLDVLSYRYAAVGIFFASVLLSIGGISAFVLIFTIYPIAKQVFEEAGLPKSLIIASIAGGNVIVGLSLPGSPQVHNLIMMDYLNTSALAGFGLGLAGISAGSAAAIAYLRYRSRSMLAESNNLNDSILKKPELSKLFNFLTAMLPLLTVFIFLAVLSEPPVIALLLGVVLSIIKNFRKIDLLEILNESISNAILPLMFAASAMGFGQVISSLPVFKEFLQTLLNLPLNPYLLIGIITNIAAGLLGSASGGMLLTLSTVGENIVQLVDPEKLHRIVIIASTGLDTLPHNSAYLAMLAYTGLKFRDTYFDYFIVTVLATLISFAVALGYAVSF
ncbi:H+/gluconate symporter-like permease [Halanaerobium saccharolyticum]|uniref:H+/gluconate symporter-like permease n=1 Tax=Halanaerobium saccharolyticum TaxID=43595 RepID=A0A4R7YUD2_9FIRM|nr:GntP family permease [Halanaerobium saccharolyticum]RAK06354.1 H+/gluconate symporter-like permease [Halanaerobium saccharolyticum]TDW00666.1 H+/gluconate symporter-like permease [Halanaerobium saccharolyticum]TDX52279.1 H+/gluconate symporter-like permease [Halanaerobium saccharolyticum]